jgi:predicted transcriptional regulator
VAATHSRRKKSESRLESETCTSTNFVEVLVNANLTIRQVLYKVLSKKGPFTARELVEELRKSGKLTNSVKTVQHELSELRKLGLVVRVNGGYAIHNWTEIGE